MYAWAALGSAAFRSLDGAATVARSGKIDRQAGGLDNLLNSPELAFLGGTPEKRLETPAISLKVDPLREFDGAQERARRRARRTRKR